ncbi:tetratricopeptide repeat protein [Caenimonas aquaedulcis]|uniref:Tetratricopeptide repeat protein n=1 Tax=Caenimonas aquaedulcis TaxID=2793270 RepID=A0A931H5M1_9BURK|nr:tetratricopeptide repeat protein [Caenimonas aquaedulcis]MBG9388902.1 tetratricopeptide repeat protein [Caenimonas aquaedulcis]
MLSRLQGWLERRLAHASGADPARRAAPLPSDGPDAGGELSEAGRRLARGAALLEQGDARGAAELLTQSLALRGEGDNFLHDLRFLLGRASRLLGDDAAALAHFEAAVAAKPGFAPAMEEAVHLLHAAQRYPEALEWAQRLAAAQPSPAASTLIAQEMHFAGRSEEALEILDGVVAGSPRAADAIRGRGHIYLKLGRGEEALAAFREVLALVGPTPDGFVHAAGALLRLGRPAEALDEVRKALELQADHAGALRAGVGILIEQLRVREAVEMARHGLGLQPADADLHWNLGVALLLLGELDAGWTEHEWRWRSSVMRRKAVQLPSQQPRWAGEDLEGRTLLVYAEQGFGDTIQFARFLPAVAARARAVWLHVPAPLEPLLRGIAPNIKVLPAEGVLPPFDFQCPLMSLPHWLGTTLATLPAQVPYLTADPQRVEAWRRKLGDGSGRKKVGVVWSGNPGHSNDHNRSIALSAFRSIAVPACEFVNLQVQMRESDREALRGWPHLVSVDGSVNDFADSAALVAALDLVVTVDTSVAHLAGALGRPVWILLPFCPDWRWMLERDDSPWYPTARLYRQQVAGDWAPVLLRVARDLQSLDGANPASVPQVDWIARGNAALGEWKLDEARECYRQAAAQDPRDPLARLNFGFVLLEQGDASAASHQLAQALALPHPEQGFAHDAHFLLGRAQAHMGRVDDAVASFESAVRSKADFAEPMEEAAKLLHGAARYDEMLAWATRLQALRQDSGADLVVAQACHALKRNAQALELVESVLTREPGNAAAWSGRGNVLMDLGRAREALQSFERALALAGPAPETLVPCATALSRLGRHDEALQRIDEALRLRPGDRETLIVRGVVLTAMVRIPEAIACADEGLALHPGDADLHWNRAMGSLLLGDYAAGWAHYESRWHAAAQGRKGRPPQFGRPWWTGGEDLSARSILLLSEQGLGDAIQFLRFVPLVAARAKSVLLRVPPSLAALASGLAPNCRVVHDGQEIPAFDFVCPLMSLPHVLGITLANLPAAVPYVTADEARVREWRERLDDGRGLLKVGVSWSGNASYNNDHHRSIPLQAFRALEAAGCEFISLQPQVRESDAQALAQWTQLRRFDEEIGTFAETAALASALDLVVTVDTVFAHLAGALGRPVWVLEAYAPDWRWMLEREDSPWYPTARLYRQPTEGDWTSVLARVRSDLTARASA